MQFMLLFSRQGKLRLQKWYVPLSDKEKKKITRELVQTVLARKPKMCSFLEWRDLKIVYKRYASLYFCCAIEDQDNELITLEIIHRYVELLDKYFGSVCELDIIFNFEKAYFILDEFLLGGEVQETSKKNVLKAIEQADLLQESTEMGNSPLLPSANSLISLIRTAWIIFLHGLARLHHQGPVIREQSTEFMIEAAPDPSLRDPSTWKLSCQRATSEQGV
ncbi:AP-1 complex subunit sigma-2 isoform X1 [Meriones unguiculatus]|uniref:AP-1 complex subunit sigma-2 isoform X1 n=1 Tax=Meriones unguiculatus TaxID=10047 RepID=UPI00293E66D8|nr:AP-1 complex subunit sigma-2 isoform X1 [Meriones unguiculatus]